MKGIILDAPNNKYSMWKSAMKAALQVQGIPIVKSKYHDPIRHLESIVYNIDLYKQPKLHEQYGWYRKFDKRKFR